MSDPDSLSEMSVEAIEAIIARIEEDQDQLLVHATLSKLDFGIETAEEIAALAGTHPPVTENLRVLIRTKRKCENELRRRKGLPAARTEWLSFVGVKKSYPDLTIEDVTRCPLWRFTNSNEAADEFEIVSVEPRPGVDLGSLTIGSAVVLADGSRHWAFVGNVSYEGEPVNEQFLTLTIWHNDKKFSLARYHDFRQEEYGPAALAAFLGKPLEDVFPIAYDLREELVSDSPKLQGFVRQEPSRRLSKEELIKWSIRRRAERHV